MFTWLNRRAGGDFDEVRSRFERWFEDFPPQAQVSLRSRFRNKDDRHHRGAQFELFMNSLMRSLGCATEANPVLPSGKTPDFLVTHNGQSLYLEATDVAPPSMLSAPDPLEDEVLDALDNIDAPNFGLDIQLSGKLENAPSIRRIVNSITELMGAHNPDEVEQRCATVGENALPTNEIRHGDWRLQWRLVPRSPEHRGDGSAPTISSIFRTGGSYDSSTPVANALVKKAKKYGDVEAPFMIAVNARDFHDKIDDMDALFGPSQVTFRFSDGRLVGGGTPSRQPDGVWVRAGPKPRSTALQAVLVFRRLSPGRPRGANACLYLNPYIPTNLPEVLMRLPRAIVKDGQMEWLPGEEIGQLLGVS